MIPTEYNIEVTPERMEKLLERAASGTLRDEDMELMRQIFASYAGFFQIVGDKNTTIARLRKLLFGATTETRRSSGFQRLAISISTQECSRTARQRLTPLTDRKALFYRLL